MTQIGKGIGKAQLRQRLPGRAVAQLGFFAQGKQSLLAALLRALVTQFQHLLHTHKCPINFFRGLGEGAVVADIATKMGKRNKHFTRISDYIAESAISQLPGDSRQGGGIGNVRQRQRLVTRGTLPRQ